MTRFLPVFLTACFGVGVLGSMGIYRLAYARGADRAVPLQVVPVPPAYTMTVGRDEAATAAASYTASADHNTAAHRASAASAATAASNASDAAAAAGDVPTWPLPLLLLALP